MTRPSLFDVIRLFTLAFVVAMMGFQVRYAHYYIDFSSSENDLREKFTARSMPSKQSGAQNVRSVEEDFVIQEGSIPVSYNSSSENGLSKNVSVPSMSSNHSGAENARPIEEELIIQEGSIPVFYNLYVGQENDSTRVRNIVSEQMAHLKSQHQPFFVQSMGVVQLDIPEATLLGHRPNGTEMVTLHSLWDFCRKNPSVEKVVYLHSKGASRNSAENENLRKFLTVGALSEDCATVDAQTCNVCSSRFSPLPHPHTSGNMWLARCDYVKDLIDPFDFEERMNDFTSNCTIKGRESCDGRLRFSAEHWIHSHPAVKPCDLYTDPSFVWDYAGVPENGNFTIELAKAPRFDLVKYVNWGKCANRGIRINHRLDEYWGLYHERPDESWWGWDFLQTDDSWMPENHKGAAKWKKRHICWNVKGDTKTKLHRAEKHEYKVAPSNYSCPSGSRIEQGPNLEQRNGTAIPSPADIKNQTLSIKGTKKRVLVIAVVPRDKQHTLALWTQLECFTIGVDAVVLAAPAWSREIMPTIVDLAKSSIPAFGAGGIPITVEYFLNNRYDVGLWCDAIATLNADEFDEYGLINDSVFALRPFSEVFDALSIKNVSFTSMSYSYTAKFFAGEDGPEHFWLESVFRGFSKKGIETFLGHSCVPEDHPFFCFGQDDSKACIVNNFEHDLAIQYPCDKVYGIYPSDTPEEFLEKNHHRTWARNIPYWRALWKNAHFPISKVKERGVRKVAQCTKHYNKDAIEIINYKTAKPRHKQNWENLDPQMKEKATSLMELDEASWKDWKALKFSSVPFNELAKQLQTFLVSSLDCSPALWNADGCGPN